MNLACGAANPEVNKSVALLKTHESTARDKYYNAQKINARKPVQNNDNLKREVTYRTYKSLLMQGQLSFRAYVENILMLYEFAPVISSEVYRTQPPI